MVMRVTRIPSADFFKTKKRADSDARIIRRRGYKVSVKKGTSFAKARGFKYKIIVTGKKKRKKK